MAAVGEIVELTIVPWGNAGVEPDGTWNCQHGNLEWCGCHSHL
jgi:hypothetical protein